MKSSRRDLFKIAGGVATGVALPAHARPGESATAAMVGRVTLPYQPRAIVELSKVEAHKPVAFSYPDADSPCLLIKLGRNVPGGIGPQGDIIAYSILCTHQGCALAYDAAAWTLNCPCHFTIFDAEKNGEMVCGQATAALPRIVLRHDPQADLVMAVAVEGLIYGRQANLL